MSEDRLAEIQSNWTTWITETYGNGKYGERTHVVQMKLDDARWLIDRVRMFDGPYPPFCDGCQHRMDTDELHAANVRIAALEAQAALDVKVREAARAYRAAERKVEAAGYASMSIGDRLIRGDLRERLDAALADAEAE